MNRNEIIRALRQEDEGVFTPNPQLEALATMLETSGMENLHPALKSWVDPETILGPMVKHPFCYMHVGPDGMMVGSANKFYEQKIKARRAYLNEGKWYGYLKCHERPYRMHALEKLWVRKKISIEQLRELLADMWVDTECPQGNQEEPLQLFREAGFTTDDPEGWAKLEAKKYFTLWRGVDYDFELTSDGPSWTTSRKVAEFFAYRFGAEGDVFKYRATPEEALAFFSGRDEAEVILDFNWPGISDASRIRKVEKGQR